MVDLSVLVPARREEFLPQTIQSVLSHAQGSIEIVVICDGDRPTLPDDPRVVIVHEPISIGQRAATNLAARIAQGRYVMKLDAHCDVSPGFDVALVTAGDALGHDVTQIPRMHNLHVFNWRCTACGATFYQGPPPPEIPRDKTDAATLQTLIQHDGACGATTFERDMVWQAKPRPITDFAMFDQELHFQYQRSIKDAHGKKLMGYQHRPDSQGEIAETMSSIGACFVMRRDRFFELGGLDEAHGSWGQFGTEISCKSWLSGGRQVVNKRAWFAHLFRTQDGFGFPYPLPGSHVERARARSRALWLQNSWPHQVRPLSWLIEKFAPLRGWHEPIGAERLAHVRAAGEAFTPRGVAMAPRATPTKGLLYYSDCRGDAQMLETCRIQIRRACNGHRLVSVTLQPLDFGENIHLDLARGPLTMFKQILAGLEALDTDIVYFMEHDVLYHPSHVEFTPPRRDTYYYNQNVWKVDAETGRALFYYCNQLSGLCAYRELLLAHYRERVRRVEAEGFSRGHGFEPGTRNLARGGYDNAPFATWMSPLPNLDIRHRDNLTPSRWRREQFRNQQYTEGWTEADAVPGWGTTAGRFRAILAEIAAGPRGGVHGTGSL